MDLDYNELLEHFSRSVVRIHIYKMETDSDDEEETGISWSLVTVIPGIVTMSGSDFCHIVACNRGFIYSNPSKFSYQIKFPDATFVELDVNSVEESGWLAAFYVPTTGKKVDAVQFNNQNASERDKVWMFGYDYKSRSLLDDGSITHVDVDDDKFLHDVSPNSMSSYGYPIFNMEYKLVGISYYDHGVTSTMNITQMTNLLSGFFNGMVGKPLLEILEHIRVTGEATFRKLKD